MALCLIIKASILFLPIYVIAEYKSFYAYIEGGKHACFQRQRNWWTDVAGFFFLSCKVHDERKFFFSYETTAFGFLKGAFTNPVQ